MASSPRRGPGKPSYADVVDERNELRKTLAVAERRLAQFEARVPELEASRDSAEQALAAERETFQVDREALHHATMLMEKQAEEAKLSPGALEYGCVHPHSAFPSDYSGTVVTDGVRWYCNANHLRVAVQTRAGLV